MTRGETIKFNLELSIKYEFTDTKIQKGFDKFGKLPGI
jgi:hypothetical protein